MSLYLGIDTSNYTTSVAVFDDETGEIIQQKKLLPVREGQLGLRQSDAVFHHTAQLHTLFERLAASADTKKIVAVGASARPRPVDGSYMPCFTVGENTAKILAAALQVPFFAFSHQEGHIAAALYGAGRPDLLNKTFIAFHVSGGTTEAVLAHTSAAAPPKRCWRRASATAFTAAKLPARSTSTPDRRSIAWGLCWDLPFRAAWSWSGSPCKTTSRSKQDRP